jgi:TusA-related sulfurtransferase
MLKPDYSFDMGELSCGELTMAIYKAMRPLPPDVVVEIFARDAAAPIDIAAWCVTTQNQLMSRPEEPDNFRYIIRKTGA